MLTGKQIDKIINGLVDQGYFPEVQESERLSKEISEEITRFTFSNLTQEEKDIIEKISNRVDVRKDGSLNRLRSYFKILNDINLSKSLDRTISLENCSGSDYFKLCYFTRFSDRISVFPRLFSSWEDLKEKYPDEWEKLNKLSIEFIKNKNSFYLKTERIRKTLGHESCNLTLLKNNYPELYNILKS